MVYAFCSLLGEGAVAAADGIQSNGNHAAVVVRLKMAHNIHHGRAAIAVANKNEVCSRVVLEECLNILSDELGAVEKVRFNFLYSDEMGGRYGFTIPGYFAYDDIAVQFGRNKVFK